MLVKSGAKRGEECRARLGWWGRDVECPSDSVVGLPQCCGIAPSVGSERGVPSLTGNNMACDAGTPREDHRSTAHSSLIVRIADSDERPKCDLFLRDQRTLYPCAFTRDDRTPTHQSPHDNRAGPQRNVSVCLDTSPDPRTTAEVKAPGNHQVPFNDDSLTDLQIDRYPKMITVLFGRLRRGELHVLRMI